MSRLYSVTSSVGCERFPARPATEPVKVVQQARLAPIRVAKGSL